MRYMKPYIVRLGTSWYNYQGWVDRGLWVNTVFTHKLPSVYITSITMSTDIQDSPSGTQIQVCLVQLLLHHDTLYILRLQVYSPVMNVIDQKQTPTEPSTGAPELAAAVDELLDQLQHKFDGVSTEIFGKRMPPLSLYFLVMLTDWHDYSWRYESTARWARSFVGWSTGGCGSVQVVTLHSLGIMTMHSTVSADLRVDCMSWALCNEGLVWYRFLHIHRLCFNHMALQPRNRDIHARRIISTLCDASNPNDNTARYRSMSVFNLPIINFIQR